MASFFDDDDSDHSPPRQSTSNAARAPPVLARRLRESTGNSSINAQASSSRHPYSPSTTSGNDTTFLSRLQSEAANGESSFGMTTVDDIEGDVEEDGGGDGDGLGVEEREGDNDVKRMARVWVKERGTVEIMRWEGELVEDCLNRLGQQNKMLNLLRSDPKTSEEEHFQLALVQTEMERVKYVVRSYVRCRLSKVEKYSDYISRTPAAQLLLSQLELEHAQASVYTKLIHSHYTSSVLESLPEWLRKMDDVANDGMSMVVKPNKSVPVLIYCLKDCGDIVLADGDKAELEKGSTHLVRYSLVERFIDLGWVDVL